MSINPEHINQLAAIIRKVSGLRQPEAADLAQAILAARPAAPSAPEPVPDKLAESLAARQLLQKVAELDNSVGITVAEVRQLAACAAAWLRENPPGQSVAIEPRGCPLPGACSCVVPGARPAPESTWAEFIRELARIQYVAQGEGRGPRFDLAIAAKALVLPVVEAERASGEVTSPCLTASDTQRLIEALDFCVGNSDYRPNSGNHHALLERLKSSAAPPAPEPGEEVGLLVAELRRLERYAMDKGSDHGDWLDAAVELDRAATWLQQLSAPAPAVVPVAVSERLPDRRPESEGGDCDAEGRCWWFSPSAFWPRKIRSCWTLDSEAMEGDTHWRPFCAIPMPQAGEVEA